MQLALTCKVAQAYGGAGAVITGTQRDQKPAVPVLDMLSRYTRLVVGATNASIANICVCFIAYS